MAESQERAARLNTESTQSIHLIGSSAASQRRRWLSLAIISIVAIALGWFIQQRPTLYADPEPFDEMLIEESDQSSANAQSSTVDIFVDRHGRTTLNGQSVKGLLRPGASFDELRYKVIDKPGFFLDDIVVRIQFENTLPAETKTLVYAVHGINETIEEQSDSHTLQYRARGVGEDATYTIVAQLPPQSFDWSPMQLLAARLQSLPLAIWLTIAAGLPLLTLVILLIMFWPLIGVWLDRPTHTVAQPPAPISPAEAGVLVKGRVSARELAATLIDLANRGYITIFSKGKDHFSVGRRKSFDDLSAFEQLLLSQIFPDQSGPKTTQQEIELQLGAQLFSQSIAKLYWSIYQSVSQLGYFVMNPAAIHNRYRYIGLMIFFLGLFLFGTALVLEIEPAAALVFLAAMMVGGLLIIALADLAPLWTPAGLAARKEWLAFEQYLAQSEPLGYVEGTQVAYQRYLPYAIVLGKELEWLNRWRQFPFALPDWYGTTDDWVAIEDFAQAVYRIVGQLAALFSAAKAPIV